MRRGSLRRRLTVVVMTSTLAALLLSAAVLLIYELRSYRSAWVADLTTQADLIAHTSAAALAFDDAHAAQENLALLRLRPQIEAAAVYGVNGKLFASYAAEPADGSPPFPVMPGPTGTRFEGDNLQLFQPVAQNGERVGTVYLAARYDVGARLRDYLAILVAVTAAGLALAAVIFGSLERALTQPILALAQAARDVVQRRDYRLKVEKTTDDEVGLLVDSFNDMLRDLSVEMEQRRKAEEALRAVDRRKDEFLATLAHELRNPLAPIATGLALLKNAAASTEVKDRAREVMTRQLRQMVRLIDDLLDVSRITSNKIELHREALDMASILRDAVELVEPSVRARSLTLEASWPDRSLWVEGDATRLTQVFVNLLNNAVKYTPPGGRVTVALAAEQSLAVTRIADNGIGIDATQQAGVFEMFVQVDRSLERERAGLGVGLSLAKRLVELHHGTIALASAGLGKGTELTVALPLVSAPGDAAAAASHPVSPPAPESAPEAVSPPTAVAAVPLFVPAPHGTALRILVADDNVDLATSLGDLLTSCGHVVRTVHDGQAAFEAALAEVPDVALFDIGMPKVNGYELARRLRAQPATHTLKMIAITGWGQEVDKQRAMEAGFDQHLVKPIEPAALLELLQSSTANSA